MKDVSLLDCTLRDGGYVNDWAFGHSVITGTYRRLEEAGVEFIEVGFLNDSYPYDPNRSICPDTKSFDRLFAHVKKGNAVPVAMIDYGTCALENIADASQSFLDGIRVIFKKEKIEQALPYCKAIKEKGYKLFIQAISITAYSELEMTDYVAKINEIHPYAFSIVDTYGLLNEEKLSSYFSIIENNLSPDIRIGYHAHNNFQLGFSNSMKFLAQKTCHSLVVDATVYGMGKSAGNCPEELLVLHMNEAYQKHYKVDPILEILDNDLMAIYQQHYWGYKYNFYISAMQNCHPNYVKYLLDKKTLSISSVNEILQNIPKEKKLLYDETLIQQMYLHYQSRTADDRASDLPALQERFNDREVLLIGPGGSLKRCEADIRAFQHAHCPVVISVNFSTALYASDFVFVSNAKRFSRLADEFADGLGDSKLIITSNITPFGLTPDYVLNYRSLLLESGQQSDNSLLLVLSALEQIGVQDVALAGFDGFQIGEQEYIDKTFSFAGNEQYRMQSNRTIAEAIRAMRNKMTIRFITPSVYEEYL